MKHLIISLLLTAFAITGASGQKFITKTGHIRFFSSTPMEDIEAHNRQVNAAIDAQTGDVVFRVLMKSFMFEKALMQEHFNENYVESDTYPNATFKGKVTNLKEVDFSKNGKYNVTIEGDLTIKDATRKIRENGTLEVDGDRVRAQSSFTVLVSDYNIKIPNTVASNISKNIKVDVDVNLEKQAR